MLLFHEVCHPSKIYLLIDGLKLENGILKEDRSNQKVSDVSTLHSLMVKHSCRINKKILLVIQLI